MKHGEPRSVGLVIAGGSTDPGYAERVAAHLNTDAAPLERKRFPDGELYVKYNSSVRGEDVYVIQSHANRSTIYGENWSPNDAIQEMGLMIDAAAGASADHVTAVIPYYGYSRQEKKDDGRVPIAARRIARQMIDAGANRVISIELHAPQIQGFTPNNEPFENLYAMSRVILPELDKWKHEKKEAGEEIVIAAPDVGRGKTARYIAHVLGCNFAIIDKERSINSHESRSQGIVGDVRGKHCALVDDMIATGGTTVTGIHELLSNGASSTIVASVHPVFSASATERLKTAIQEGDTEKIIVTDTLPLPLAAQEMVRSGKIIVAETTEMVADVIRRIHHNESVSESGVFDQPVLKDF